jgi:miniconductance mechanosensitive channel
MDLEALGVSKLLEDPLVAQGLGLVALFAAAWISLFIVRRVIVAGLRFFVSRSSATWDDRLVDAKLFVRLAHLAPAIVVSSGVRMIPHLDESLSTVISRLAASSIVLVIALSISAFLNAINEIYSGLEAYRSRPIKGYVQLLKLVVGVVAAVVIVATLFDKSPLIFLSGLGAMTAVILLVFKDTILSLVASVQLTANDMIRVGDWIEMPQYQADGDVIDIALHKVSVQNWDKTITSIPTHKFIEDSFRNWRGMSESGGRRIKRSICIDMNSIRFLEPAEVERFSHFLLLRDYIAKKRDDVAAYNAAEGGNVGINANIRRLTNVGTWRAYILQYLRANPMIRDDMTLLVRQLDPTPQGLPIEIYCFSKVIVWDRYEDIQSDIIDHLLAVAPDFGLRAYQSPSGHDLAGLASRGA